VLLLFIICHHFGGGKRLEKNGPHSGVRLTAVLVTYAFLQTAVKVDIFWYDSLEADTPYYLLCLFCAGNL